MKWNKYTSKIAMAVEIIEHKIDGRIIDVGSLLPALASIPIIDVGRS